MKKDWQQVNGWPIEMLLPSGKGFPFRFRNMGIKTGKELSEQTEESLRRVRKGAHFLGAKSVAAIQNHLEAIGLPRLPANDEEKMLLNTDDGHRYRD